MKSFNAKYLSVLVACVAGAASADVVAKKCKMEVTAARGALRSLRGSGHLSGDNDAIVVTKAGNAQVAAPAGSTVAAETTTPTGRQHNRRTNMAKAITLFERHVHQGRSAVIGKFQSKLEMTTGCASTYYQNIRKEKGLTASA